MRRRVSSLVAAALLGLVVLVANVVPASAATTPTVYAIQPGSTPVVPASVVTTSGDTAGAHESLPGLLWSGVQGVAQSIQDAAWKAITALVGKPDTSTGQGTATAPYCQRVVTMGGGSWGALAPVVATSTLTGKGAQANFKQSDCDSASTGVGLTCFNASSGAYTGASSQVTTSGGVTGTGCGSNTAVAARVAPSGASCATGCTDGGYWRNPAFDAQLQGSTIISTSKTCAPSSGSGASITVRADGGYGTGVAPTVSCPSGYYATGQRTWSHLPGDNQVQELGSSTISTGTFSAYPECVGPAAPAAGCSLSVYIDGVKCVLLGLDCDKWLDRSQTAGGGGVTCKWGNYTMPVSDCKPLTNCYQVPLDSIQTGAGAPSGCGIDPSKPANVAPQPIQDGHIVPSPGTGPQPTTSASATFEPDPTPAAGQPTIVVNVPQPTVIVNVPQPTVVVTVQGTSPSEQEGTPPTSIPGGSSGSTCWDGGASTGAAAGSTTLTGKSVGADAIREVAESYGVTLSPHTDPQGHPAFDVFGSGDLNTRMAETYRLQHERFGAYYVISQMRIASGKSDWNWRPYTPITSSGDYQHVNHVHISYGDRTSGASAALNPLDWVYTPVHCALGQAMAPSPGKAEATGEAISTALGAPLKPWTDAVGAYASAFDATPGDCLGPPLALGHPFNHTYYLASSCEEPMRTLAMVSRVGTGAVLILTGLWSCVRLLASGIGYGGVSAGGDGS